MTFPSAPVSSSFGRGWVAPNLKTKFRPCLSTVGANTRPTERRASRAGGQGQPGETGRAVPASPPLGQPPSGRTRRRPRASRPGASPGRWCPRRACSPAGRGRSAAPLPSESPNARDSNASDRLRGLHDLGVLRLWSPHGRRATGAWLHLAVVDRLLCASLRQRFLRVSVAQSVSAFGC